MNYLFDEIIINNRLVIIQDIIKKTVVAHTSFEENTFSFIRDWFLENEVFTLQTSGSTGTPKQITLTRNQLKQSAVRTLKALQLVSEQTVLVCLDTKYIAGKMMLVRAFEGNLKIVATEPSSNPLKNITENEINFAAFVPMQLQEILNDPSTKNRLNQFNKIIIGGAPINASLELIIQKLSCKVFATYGMTETVSHIALKQINGLERSAYFKTLPGISISKDERDCLVIKLPEFSEKIITNDLVDIIEENCFQWEGRWDNIINSGGYKISPEQLEEKIGFVFNELSINKRFIVSNHPDDRLGQKLILVIEGEKITQEQERLLLKKLKSYIHPYELPKTIHYIKEFTLTNTGKINRGAIGRALSSD